MLAMAYTCLHRAAPSVLQSYFQEHKAARSYLRSYAKLKVPVAKTTTFGFWSALIQVSGSLFHVPCTHQLECRKDQKGKPRP